MSFCDDSFLVSIQRESCVRGANAMSASFDGSGASIFDRTSRSFDTTVFPIADGSQRDAGDTPGSIATLRGPVRRSYRNAIALRQFPAAC